LVVLDVERTQILARELAAAQTRVERERFAAFALGRYEQRLVAVGEQQGTCPGLAQLDVQIAIRPPHDRDLVAHGAVGRRRHQCAIGAQRGRGARRRAGGLEKRRQILADSRRGRERQHERYDDGCSHSTSNPFARSFFAARGEGNPCHAV
jgi:hypothetical protein